MPHIVSTLTSDVKYVFWKKKDPKAPGGPNVKEVIDGRDHVLIKGGHGIVRRNGTDGVSKPDGVVTQVTEAQLAILEADEVFQTHLKFGAVKVMRSKPSEPAKVARDMSLSPDRPLTAKDSEKGGRAAETEGLKQALQ